MKTALNIGKSSFFRLFTVIFLSMFLVLTGCASVNLQDGKANITSKNVNEHILDNGLKILLVEDHKSPIATFQIWYKVGSKSEPKGKTGLSHYLEHTMFKGTPKFSSKKFSRIIQQNGGVDNAFTTKDYTMYYQTLISDRITLSMEMESDRMVNLLLNPKEVMAEKNVIMEERRLRYEDDPQNLLFEKVTAKALTTHPYRNPVIGWMEDIRGISRKDLLDYYKTFYSPKNAFIIISGDIDSKKIIKDIKRYFGSIPAVEVPKEYLPKEPEQTQMKEITLRKQAKLPFILMAYHVPSIPHKDSYALEILTSIFSGKSGRLYQHIVKEKDLALDAFSYYNGFYQNPYLYYFGGTLKPGKDVEALKAAIFEEIEVMKISPPTQRELQKAKNRIVSDFIMGLDSTYFQAHVLGMFEILGNWRLKETYIEKINSVTASEVSRVAKKYLSESNSTVGTLIPTK